MNPSIYCLLDLNWNLRSYYTPFVEIWYKLTAKQNMHQHQVGCHDKCHYIAVVGWLSLNFNELCSFSDITGKHEHNKADNDAHILQRAYIISIVPVNYCSCWHTFSDQVTKHYITFHDVDEWANITLSDNCAVFFVFNRIHTFDNFTYLSSCEILHEVIVLNCPIDQVFCSI